MTKSTKNRIVRELIYVFTWAPAIFCLVYAVICKVSGVSPLSWW